MTWLLFVFGVLGPAIVGTYDDEKACYQAANEYAVMLMHENLNDPKWRPPPLACVGVEDPPPHASDGERI
jgi:hypothetical protein